MKCRTLVTFLSLASPLLAGYPWPKIPAEVWTMKEDPAKGIMGAVVLEERLTLNNISTNYLFRVRILSDKGRRAAQLPLFSKHVHDIEGRTIYPDGQEVLFNKEKDFTKSEFTTRSGFGLQVSRVIPPGVNGNCVVEIRWTESGTPKFGPLPDYSLSRGWGLGNDFPTLLTSLEIPIAYPYSFLVFGGSGTSPKQSEKGSMKIYTWEHLPSFELPPYALDPTMPRPRVFAFYQNEDLRDPAKYGPDKYWSVVANSYVKWSFNRNVSKGSAFKALVAEGLSLAPADAPPHTKAARLLELLNRKVRILDQLTFREQALRNSKQQEQAVEAKDLEDILTRGETDSAGMVRCFFHLLIDAGLNPKLAFTTNREQALFNFNATNYYQVSEWLVGLDEGPMTYWYDPSVRFITPGVIRAGFQGAPALLVDPRTWAASRGTLPIQAGAVNQRRFVYRVDLAEDEDRFQVKAEFSGIPEQTERDRYLKLEPKEQSKVLRESFEKAIQGCTIESAELTNVVQPTSPLAYLVKGRIEREGTRTRRVDPFPGMDLPLWIPDQLPDSRSLPIVLPYLSVNTAEALIQVPKGYRFGGGTPFQQRNQFGSVTWSATATEKDGATQIRCNYRVEVTTFAALPGAYGDFKAFLGWVSEAGRRQLVLEKAR